MDDSGLGKWILDKLEKLDDKLDDVKIDQAESRKTFELHEGRDNDRHAEIKKMHESIHVRLDDQHKSLDEYNKQLEIHIKGVKALESRQDAMWARVEPIVGRYEQEKQVKKWLSDGVRTRIKWVAYTGTIAGTIATILKLLNII